MKYIGRRARGTLALLALGALVAGYIGSREYPERPQGSSSRTPIVQKQVEHVQYPRKKLFGRKGGSLVLGFEVVDTDGLSWLGFFLEGKILTDMDIKADPNHPARTVRGKLSLETYKPEYRVGTNILEIRGRDIHGNTLSQIVEVILSRKDLSPAKI